MNSLEVNTNIIGCVNRCRCCPQDVLVAAYKSSIKQFSLLDFDGILCKLPREFTLEFCGYSEPFLNPACAVMMQMTTDAGIGLKLLTTLTGFKKDDIHVLQRCHIQYIRIHVPDTVQFTTNEDAWMARHRLFYEAQLPADYDHLAMGPMSPKIRGYLAGMGVTNVRQMNYVTRCGSVEPAKEIKTGELYCCRERWHRNDLLPNGDVHLCSMDFALEQKLGNLIEQSYADIYWAAERLMLSDHSKLICARCEWAQPGGWYHPFGRPAI